MRLKYLLSLALVFAVFTPGLAAQWDPNNGDWTKADASDIRFMTWNVQDGICSSNLKTEAQNNWTAIVLHIASMQPDVLIC